MHQDNHLIRIGLAPEISGHLFVGGPNRFNIAVRDVAFLSRPRRAPLAFRPSPCADMVSNAI
jgi:hypothetical protein